MTGWLYHDRPVADRAAETVSVSGTPEGARRAAAAFDEFCRAGGVPDEARWRFLLALDEVLSNVVRHGYRDSSGAMTVTFGRTDREVSVRIVDTGPEFDPRQAPAPDTTSPLETRQPGGLGVYLAGALLDELAYERRGHENHVTLTWRVRE